MDVETGKEAATPCETCEEPCEEISDSDSEYEVNPPGYKELSEGVRAEVQRFSARSGLLAVLREFLRNPMSDETQLSLCENNPVSFARDFLDLVMGPRRFEGGVCTSPLRLVLALAIARSKRIHKFVKNKGILSKLRDEVHRQMKALGEDDGQDDEDVLFYQLQKRVREWLFFGCLLEASGSERVFWGDFRLRFLDLFGEEGHSSLPEELMESLVEGKVLGWETLRKRDGFFQRKGNVRIYFHSMLLSSLEFEPHRLKIKFALPVWESGKGVSQHQLSSPEAKLLYSWEYMTERAPEASADERLFPRA